LTWKGGGDDEQAKVFGHDHQCIRAGMS
jgi:hypothetical protein